MYRRERGQFLGRHWVWGVDPGGPSLEEMEAARGRGAEILGPTVLGGGTDVRMHGTLETGSDPGHVDGTLGLCGDRDRRGPGHPGQ